MESRILLLFCGALEVLSSGPSPASRLRVEYLDRPLAIDVCIAYAMNILTVISR